jgi:hypothetical protein
MKLLCRHICPYISCYLFTTFSVLRLSACRNWLHNYIITFMLQCTLHNTITLDDINSNSIGDYSKGHVGGAKIQRELTGSDLEPHLVEWSRRRVPLPDAKMKFTGYMVEAHARARFDTHKHVIVYECPLPFLLLHLTVPNLRTIAGNHNIFVISGPK